MSIYENETTYLRDAFDNVMRATYNVEISSFVIAYDDDEIIRVRINDDDEYTFACAVGSDDDEYEFHHASFDDRIVIRIPLYISPE